MRVPVPVGCACKRSARGARIRAPRRSAIPAHQSSAAAARSARAPRAPRSAVDQLIYIYTFIYYTGGLLYIVRGTTFDGKRGTTFDTVARGIRWYHLRGPVRRAIRPAARGASWPVAAVMPASAPHRRLRAVAFGSVLSAAVALLLPATSAWPLFFNGSGTTQLSSAFGADVLLSPSTGASARAAPHLRTACGTPCRATTADASRPQAPPPPGAWWPTAWCWPRRRVARMREPVRQALTLLPPHVRITRACSWAARR